MASRGYDFHFENSSQDFWDHVKTNLDMDKYTYWHYIRNWIYEWMTEHIKACMKEIEPSGEFFMYPDFLYDALRQELDMLTNTFIYYQNKSSMNDTVWTVFMGSVVNRWIELIRNRMELNRNRRDFTSELVREPPWQTESVKNDSKFHNPPSGPPNYLRRNSVFGISSSVVKPNFSLVSPGPPLDLTNSIGSTGSFMHNMAAAGFSGPSGDSKWKSF